MIRFGILLLLFVSAFCAHTVSAAVPSCYNSIVQNFFNPVLVNQALSMHDDIYQSSWSEISRNLKSQTTDIPRLVKERASKIHPNPFDIPFNPEVAGEVLKQVLVGILAQTLTYYQINNSSNKANDIFNYLQHLKMEQWNECFIPVVIQK